MPTARRWTLTFPTEQPRRQTFEAAEPGPGQRLAAICAVIEAREALPGLRDFDEVRYFTDAWPGSTTLDGYWSPMDPDVIYIRSGLLPEATSEMVLHECAHVMHYHAKRNVGDEELPERFAAGDPDARSALRRLLSPPIHIR